MPQHACAYMWSRQGHDAAELVAWQFSKPSILYVSPKPVSASQALAQQKHQLPATCRRLCNVQWQLEDALGLEHSPVLPKDQEEGTLQDLACRLGSDLSLAQQRLAAERAQASQVRRKSSH